MKKIDKNKSFIFYWLIVLIIWMSNNIISFSLSVWIYQEVRSVFLYALFPIMGMAPIFLLSPLLGTVIDRISFKKALSFASLGTLIAFFIISQLMKNSFAMLPAILFFIVMASSCIAVLYPAMSSYVSRIKNTKNETRYSALLQILILFTTYLSPIFGGILLAKTNIETILSVIVIMNLIGNVLLLTANFFTERIDNNKVLAQKSFLEDMKKGYQYLSKNKQLRKLIIIWAAVNLLVWLLVGSALPLFIEIATKDIMTLLLLLVSIGTVAGSLLMIFTKLPKKQVVLLYILHVIVSIHFLIAGFIQNPITIAIISPTAFMLIAIIFTIYQNIAQKNTKERYAGRFMAYVNMALSGAALLAYIVLAPVMNNIMRPLAGLIKNDIGTAASTSILWIAIGSSLLLIGIWGISNKNMKKLDQQR
jgi:MFS transporter, DHA3 family, macrolide efflux protein